MKLKKTRSTFKWMLPILVGFLVVGMMAPLGYGDDDDHKDKSSKREKDKKSWFVYKKIGVEPVTDTLYLKECGACHFAYQPGLLPSASWIKIMDGLDDHFGQIALLAEEDHAHISGLLQENAAEFSHAKRSFKIVRSLKGETPIRISEVPYILREHDEISSDTLALPSIKWLGNCSACHTSAGDGVYDDDYVKIPKNQVAPPGPWNGRLKQSKGA